jgi:hypothetical protein
MNDLEPRRVPLFFILAAIVLIGVLGFIILKRLYG